MCNACGDCEVVGAIPTRAEDPLCVVKCSLPLVGFVRHELKQGWSCGYGLPVQISEQDEAGLVVEVDVVAPFLVFSRSWFLCLEND